MKKDVSIFKKLLLSFDTSPDGFSARKLSAFLGVVMGVYCTIHYVDGTTVISAIMVWLTFSLLCLGIITAEQILRFKGQQPEEKPQQTNNDNTNQDPKI